MGARTTPEVGVGLVRVLDAVSSGIASQVFSTAIAIDLFGTVADAPVSASDVEARLGLHPRAVPDFLDALTAMGLLLRSHDGDYVATPATARHLACGSPDFIGPFVAADPSEELVHLLRTGSAPEPPGAGDPYADPAVAGAFIAFMDAMNAMISHELVESIDWTAYGSFLDVDGASGGLARALVAAHPHLTGTVVDRPEVEGAFRAAQDAEPATAGRVGFVATGEGPLPRADVVLVGGVLHDKSPAERKDLLGRVRDAVEPEGLALVYDIMIDDGRSALAPLLGSIQMMLTVPDGGKYTESECRSWVEGAGLGVIAVQPMGVDTLIVSGPR